MTGTAVFSDCQRFRYTLTRTWDESKPTVAFLALNPSIATAEIDDPTIRRCIGFAKSWGYGGLLILNLFAYRATLPSDMKKAAKRGVDVIGGERNWVESLKRYAAEFGCEMVVAAWGTHGGERGRMVKRQWPELRCLAVNADNSPKHPLYLKGDLKPIQF